MLVNKKIINENYLKIEFSDWSSTYVARAFNMVKSINLLQPHLRWICRAGQLDVFFGYYICKENKDFIYILYQILGSFQDFDYNILKTLQIKYDFTPWIFQLP